MKKFLFFLLAACMIGFVSCSKDDEGGEDPVNKVSKDKFVKYLDCYWYGEFEYRYEFIYDEKGRLKIWKEEKYDEDLEKRVSRDKYVLEYRDNSIVLEWHSYDYVNVEGVKEYKKGRDGYVFGQENRYQEIEFQDGYVKSFFGNLSENSAYSYLFYNYEYASDGFRCVCSEGTVKPKKDVADIEYKYSDRYTNDASLDFNYILEDVRGVYYNQLEFHEVFSAFNLSEKRRPLIETAEGYTVTYWPNGSASYNQPVSETLLFKTDEKGRIVSIESERHSDWKITYYEE